MYNSKVDLWSIGVVFYYMLTGDYLFGYSGEKNIYNKIMELAPRLASGEQFREFSPEVADLLSKLLEVDARKRIEWEDFFQHRVFQQPVFREIVIDSPFFGLRLLSDFASREDFDKNNQSLMTGKNVWGKSTNFSFEVSGLDRAKRRKVKFHQSHINRNFKSGLSRAQEAMDNDMKDLKGAYIHEINKYVFLWYLFEKSRHFRLSGTFKSAHRSLDCLLFMLLKQKQIRVNDYFREVSGHQNVLNCKNRKIFDQLKNSRDYFNLIFYFKQLSNIYDQMISQGERALSAYGNSPDTLGLLKMKKMSKKKQRDIWFLLYQDSAIKKALQSNFIEKKAYLLFLLELLYVIKLSKNFCYYTDFPRGYFCWKRFNQELKVMSLSKIIKSIKILLKKYEWIG